MPDTRISDPTLKVRAPSTLLRAVADADTRLYDATRMAAVLYETLGLGAAPYLGPLPGSGDADGDMDVIDWARDLVRRAEAAYTMLGEILAPLGMLPGAVYYDTAGNTVTAEEWRAQGARAARAGEPDWTILPLFMPALRV
jgi:hypothetical protein